MCGRGRVFHGVAPVVFHPASRAGMRSPLPPAPAVVRYDAHGWARLPLPPPCLASLLDCSCCFSCRLLLSPTFRPAGYAGLLPRPRTVRWTSHPDWLATAIKGHSGRQPPDRHIADRLIPSHPSEPTIRPSQPTIPTISSHPTIRQSPVSFTSVHIAWCWLPLIRSPLLPPLLPSTGLAGPRAATRSCVVSMKRGSGRSYRVAALATHIRGARSPPSSRILRSPVHALPHTHWPRSSTFPLSEIRGAPPFPCGLA